MSLQNWLTLYVKNQHVFNRDKNEPRGGCSPLCTLLRSGGQRHGSWSHFQVSFESNPVMKRENRSVDMMNWEMYLMFPAITL